jgi:hypothetical protein
MGKSTSYEREKKIRGKVLAEEGWGDRGGQKRDNSKSPSPRTLHSRNVSSSILPPFSTLSPPLSCPAPLIYCSSFPTKSAQQLLHGYHRLVAVIAAWLSIRELRVRLMI